MTRTPIVRIAIDSIKPLSPTQLMQCLARFQASQYHHLNPIWLNNQQQNVIGILPKFFIKIAPSTNLSTSSQPAKSTYAMTQSCFYRQYLPDLSKLTNAKNTDKQLSRQCKEQCDKQCNKPLDNQLNNQSYKITHTTHDKIQPTIDMLIDYCQQHQPSVDNKHANYNANHNINDDDKCFDKHPSNNRYQDGLMGFISYDVMASSLAQPEQFDSAYFTQAQPTAAFGHYDVYLTYETDHQQKQWYLNTTSVINQDDIANLTTWLQQLTHTWCNQYKQNPTSALSQPAIDPQAVNPTAINCTPATKTPINMLPHWSKHRYQQAFQKVQHHLLAGDCYQINLTQAWQAQLPKQHLLADYLPVLHQKTNAPFAGYLQLADEANQPFELLSCSPELFFTFHQPNRDGEHSITTKPIKGTRPRGETTIEDQRLKDDLSNSEKDLAENVMIVDLLRNDLGKYAKTGTVKVPKRFAIESFNNVHHMVSTITATLKKDCHPLQVLFGSLPAGSITGTPKKRAVELIQQIEGNNKKALSNRGAYCGTMGYLNFDGSGQWNVLIRTLQAYNNQVTVWAGGGITVASDCEAEYQECWDKIANILEVMANGQGKKH